MDLIRVAFADDDPGMRSVVQKILERSGGFEVVGEASDGRELLEIVERERPQLVVLDVEMPNVTGVEAAREIQDTDPSTILIFSTAHEQYMADAFSVYAFDYLLKPYKVARALQTLERVKDVLRTRERAEKAYDAGEAPAAPATPRPAPTGRLMLKHREGVSLLNMDDILLVQRENRATVVYTVADQGFITADSLGDIETKLDRALFFRCHKSYIINLNQIDSITPYGRWTYIVKLKGTKRDALITHEKYEELEKLFG